MPVFTVSSNKSKNAQRNGKRRFKPEVRDRYRQVTNEFRGRVFATLDTLTWSMMMISMMGAGIASQTYSPRAIGAVAGVLSSTTAIFWAWANWTGRLPEPAAVGVDPDEVEVHGDPVA